MLEYNAFKTDEIINLAEDLENLIYFVDGSSMVLIHGPRCSGKSVLIRELVRRRNVVYVPQVGKELDLDSALKIKRTLLTNSLKKVPKNKVVVLDNVEKLPLNTYKKLQFYFDQGIIKSLVITTRDKSNLKLPMSFQDRIGKKVIGLYPLAKNDIIRLVSDRIEEDLDLEKIYEDSKDNYDFFIKVNEELEK